MKIDDIGNVCYGHGGNRQDAIVDVALSLRREARGVRFIFRTPMEKFGQCQSILLPNFDILHQSL
jgi:hypothetical protein